MVRGQAFNRSQLEYPTPARARQLTQCLPGVTIIDNTVTLGSSAYDEVNLMMPCHQDETQTVIPKLRMFFLH